MANTLTDLIPDMFEARDVISRELVGMIPSVTRDSSAARAAVGENVLVPVTREHTSADTTPGVTAPDTGDTTVDNVPVTISKSKHVPVRFNGEETLGLSNSGTFSTIMANRFYQAMRTLTNEIEVDLWTEAYTAASRAYGTAGTTPFGTAGDFMDFANTARILDENGAPKTDRQLVLGHAAIANLRGKQSVLFKVNEAGSSDMLRNGMTDRIQNFAIRHSDAVGLHTKGGATGGLINNAAGEAIGQTSLTLDTITVNTTGYKAGDIITAAADSTNKYVVGTGLVATSGELVLNKPGLLTDLPDNNALTVGNSYTANLAFDRSAVLFASRAPAAPKGGDMASDVYQMTDPVSGLVFEFALYKQFMQNVIHIRLAWGQAAIKSAHIATLLG